MGQLDDEYFASGDLLDGVLDDASDTASMVHKIFISVLKKNIGKQLEDLDFKSNSPVVAERLVEELKKKSPELKKVFADQLKSALDVTTFSVLNDERQTVYKRYDEITLEETNIAVKALIEKETQKQKKNIQYAIFSLLTTLVVVLLGKRFLKFREFILMLSLSSIVFLLLGVSLPMIDLDARLNAITFKLFGSDISFEEQILYYQSKSIIDVTETLLRGRGFDLKFVGVLILLFSIVVPFTKLVASTFFLYVEKVKNSKVAQVIIYYLGKWSMADVFTVAIFMSYIGFYGLLNTQLGEISADSNSYAIDTVNYSKLSPGFIFFTSYCILSIVISIFIQRHQKAIVSSN
jgi:hypothetical protein